MRLFAVSAVILALSTPALAQTPWTATPAQPVTKKGFVAATVIWDCDGAQCTAKSDTSNAIDRAECKKLAATVGALTGFVGDAGPFNADKLAACNAWAVKPKP